MIEIKFRGKSLKTGRWVYGYYVHLEDFMRGRETHRIYSGLADSMPGGEGYDFSADYEDVDSDTIGQYTGWKDENGQEIYEGDILDLYIPKNNIGKPEHRKRKVIWKYSGFQITNMRDDCVMDRVTSTIELIYTVIGNIHDNPELIEK